MLPIYFDLIFDSKKIKLIIDKIVPVSPKYIAIISDIDILVLNHNQHKS